MVDQISKIDSLSPERMKKIEEISARWQTSVRQDEVDRGAVEHAIAAVYKEAGLERPNFIWCESVFQYVTMNGFLFLIANDPTDEVRDLFDSELKEPLWVKSWKSLKAQLEAVPSTVEQMRLRVADGRPVTRRSSFGSTHLMEHVGNTNVDMKLSLKIAEATESLAKVIPDAFGLKAKLQLRGHLSQLRDNTSIMLRGRFPDRSLRRFIPGDLAEELSVQVSESTREKIENLCGCLTKEKSALEGAFGGEAPKPKPIERLFRDMLSESTRLVPERFLPSVSDEAVVFAFVAEELRTILEEKPLRLLESQLTIVDNAVDYTPYKIVCFISEPPLSTALNQRNFLHNQNGPAITFRDGYQVFAVNGVTVPPAVLNQSITIEQIDQQQNVEIRRIMIQWYGMNKYIEDSGARIISEDEFGILYKKDLAMDEPIVMVKVINATKEPDGSGAREFFLRVPPYMVSAKEAVAWTFQMDGSDYEPAQES